MAFNAIKKVFKRFGGKYVSHYGKSYFELVVEENGSRRDMHNLNDSCKVGILANNSPVASESVLNQLQTQLSRLADAGHQLIKEA